MSEQLNDITLSSILGSIKTRKGLIFKSLVVSLLISVIYAFYSYTYPPKVSGSVYVKVVNGFDFLKLSGADDIFKKSFYENQSSNRIADLKSWVIDLFFNEWQNKDSLANSIENSSYFKERYGHLSRVDFRNKAKELSSNFHLKKDPKKGLKITYSLADSVETKQIIYETVESVNNKVYLRLVEIFFALKEKLLYTLKLKLQATNEQLGWVEKNVLANKEKEYMNSLSVQSEPYVNASENNYSENMKNSNLALNYDKFFIEGLIAKMRLVFRTISIQAEVQSINNSINHFTKAGHRNFAIVDSGSFTQRDTHERINRNIILIALSGLFLSIFYVVILGESERTKRN